MRRDLENHFNTVRATNNINTLHLHYVKNTGGKLIQEFESELQKHLPILNSSNTVSIIQKYVELQQEFKHIINVPVSGTVPVNEGSDLIPEEKLINDDEEIDTSADNGFSSSFIQQKQFSVKTLENFRVI